ncbi:MAG: tRNA (guanosine(46)-N7)-methyltransferase TrmB [Luteibaculaceae bacterium]
MGKNKLMRFTQINAMPHVFEPDLVETLKGESSLKNTWQQFFGNTNPIVLELGCGKGEYTVNLAKRYPEKNFIGSDIKGARIWVGATTVKEEQIQNAAFLRCRIEFIEHYFGANEIDEIWLTFSDPQPRNKKGNKRLSSQQFIERYLKFLKPGGLIHVKTDSDLLYQFTLETVAEGDHKLLLHSNDIHNEIEKFTPEMQSILSIKTHYEQLFSAKGFSIKYVQFIPKRL